MLRVTDNGKAFDARLARDLGNDLPFAVARGLTWTLKEVKDTNPKWVRRTFDSPVPWTVNAMALKAVTKRAPGRVFFKDKARSGGKGVPAGKYLLPNIRGGSRVHSRWERYLIAKGIMLRSEYAMPTDYSVDRNGNVQRRLYAEVIAQLRIGTDGIGNATDRQMALRRKRNVERIFLSQRQDGGLPRGIWQRDFESGEVTPLFIFVKARPRYRAIYHWKVWTARHFRQRASHHIHRSANAILRKPNR